MRTVSSMPTCRIPTPSTFACSSAISPARNAEAACGSSASVSPARNRAFVSEDSDCSTSAVWRITAIVSSALSM